MSSLEGIGERLESGELTVDETIDMLGEAGAYQLFYGGPIDAEIDHDRETVDVYRESLNQRFSDGPSKELKAPNRSGLGYLWVPIDIPIHDIPYTLGKKSAGLVAGGEGEAKAENGAGYLLDMGAIGGLGYDILVETTQGSEGLPDEALIPAVLGGVFTSNILQGRADGIRENIYTNQLEPFVEEADDYTVELY